jgi:hypothetical protein
LQADGRTLAQGALAWIWARSQLAVPIPGFKNEAQVQENVAAAGFGALDAERMARIDSELRQFGPPLPPFIREANEELIDEPHNSFKLLRLVEIDKESPARKRFVAAQDFEADATKTIVVLRFTIK